MSDASWKRIEKAIERFGDRQEEICDRIASLERSVAALGQSGGASRDEVISFLDQFRAGEALGEASLGAWIAVCQTDCLRGGLRTVQTREGSHARLLEERIKELGGSPKHEIPEAIYQQVMEGAGSAERTDVEKVKEFVERFPDIDEALRPIHQLADRLDDDQETQFLLRSIAQDERATLELLQDACKLLST
jgi:hypothetical protein